MNVTNERYLGIYETVDRSLDTSTIYLPANARRYSYEFDGTRVFVGNGFQVANPDAGYSTEFSPRQLEVMNAEDGETVGIDATTDVGNVFYSFPDIRILFPEPREVYAVMIGLEPSDTANADKYTETDGTNTIFTYYGYLFDIVTGDPYVITPVDVLRYADSYVFEPTDPYPEATFNIAEAWSFDGDMDSTVEKKTVLVGVKPTYLRMLRPLPDDVTVEDKFNTSELFQLLMGASGYTGTMYIKYLHIWGKPIVNETRVMAFVDESEVERTSDIGFQAERGGEECTFTVWLKNITEFKIAKGVSLHVDDNDSSGISSDLRIFDGEGWVTSLALGDFEPGEVSDPIECRYIVGEDSEIGLLSSRLRCRTTEVE